jgi:cytoskeleton protein RodZ
MSTVTDPRYPDDPRLGDLLREARESRDLDLSDIAGLTHVRRDYLVALEEGRYSELPEDVYTRNFVRLYAQAVGFDLVRAHELYRSERRDADGFNTVEQRLEHDRELAADVPPLSEGGRWWETSGPPPRWGALLSTVLMVLAVVGLALWGFNSTFFNPSRTTPTDDAPEATVAPAPGGPGAEQETVEQPSTLPRTVRLSVSSTPPGAEVSVDEFPLPGVTPIQSAPVSARASRTIRVTLDGYQPAEQEFDMTFDRNLSFALRPIATAPEEAEEPAAGEGAPAAGAGDAAQATLRITEDTWLEVYQGTARNQGQRLAFATYRAGQTLRFPLPVYIHVGNAGGVELSVDGQDRGQLGSSGEVRGVAVTR